MKKIVTSMAVALAATSAFAGGLLTTTNQNAHSLRFFSQEADINLSSLYANPAGQAFLKNGWHISGSAMTAVQTRNIATTFPLYAFKDGKGTHEFEGKALAPVIPSIDFAYVQDKWSVSARFGVVAGGGTCEFENGLGSLEAVASNMIMSGVQNALPGQLAAMGIPAANIPGMVQNIMTNQFRYKLNSNLTGKQNYFGFQVGGTYKVLDNMSVYGGVRGIYATCGYTGGIQNMQYSIDGGQNFSAASPDIMLDCQQSGMAVTPIIGIHYRPVEGLELAAKYEFKTRVKLENTTTPESAAATQLLPLYADGKKVRTDLPALLTVGAQYRPVKNVKLAASWRYYFDKAATKDGYIDGQKVNMYDLIDDNTMEFLASAEWKFCKWVAVSASWQKTSFGLSDAYMSDTDFTVSSNSVGGGLRIYPCNLLSIDLGYMHTFYEERTVNTPAKMMSNVYTRNNNVVGIGLNFAW